jgi:uncharacterized repeat protein (TIGR03899 family)
MSNTDIIGFGKVFPVDKLFDVVSKALGKLSKSYFDRRDIETRAYEIRKIAEARADEMKIISKAVQDNYRLTGGIEYKEEKLAISSPKETNAQKVDPNPLELRAKNRIEYQESKKQMNIESITAFATDELKNEPEVTSEPLDEDWTTRFFKIAEEISNEDMQALWGKILAGEVKQPKSFSLRTLELIRNLSKDEAQTFLKVANFAIKSGETIFVFKGTGNVLSDTYKVHYTDIALLTETGLIQPGDFVNFQLLQQTIDGQTVFTSGSIVVIAKKKANTPTIQIPIYLFSNSGKELLRLITTNAPFGYLSEFSKSMNSDFVDVKYGHILKIDGGMISHTQPLQEFH